MKGVKADCIDHGGITRVGREKELKAAATGCGPTWRVNSLVCVCLKMWACQHQCMSSYCAGGLMRWLRFTVHTKSFICQSRRKIRRYQRFPCRSHLALSSFNGGSAGSGGWREDSVFPLCADFIGLVALRICRTAIREPMLSLTQGPFFFSLPHTWAK